MMKLPTLSDALNRYLEDACAVTDSQQAEQQWQGAIAALQQLLQRQPPAAPPDTSGLLFSGPIPFIDPSTLPQRFSAWTLTTDAGQVWGHQLLPASEQSVTPASLCHMVPLWPEDPLGQEQFCLVITADFAWVGVLSAQSGFQFSFAPEVVYAAWTVVRSRLALNRPTWVAQLNDWMQHHPIPEPHYTIPMAFSRQLLTLLTQPALRPAAMPVDLEQRLSAQRTGDPPEASDLSEAAADLQLLQAIAHEVRTPLTTINTLTRLLLKRSDLPADVLKRLDTIARECTDQIDRFSLIFRAVELETAQTQPTSQALAPVSLTQVLQANLPRWRQQAARRNLTLQTALPANLPVVVSDPLMLDQVLTGLIEHLSHVLPPGSEIHLGAALAGEQLKLQLRSHTGAEQGPPVAVSTATPLQSVGQVLMVQPETGNLSLSLPVTKNLFQALGGKLTVRKCPEQGEVLTIFLPLG